MKLFFLLIMSVFSSIAASADCVTGYACPINELKIQETKQKESFNAEADKYSKPEISEDFMPVSLNDAEYKNLFPFTLYLERRAAHYFQ